MSAASCISEDEDIAASCSKKKTDSNEIGASSDIVPPHQLRRRRPTPNIVKQKHIHQHHVNISISMTGSPLPNEPIVVQLNGFPSYITDNIPNLGVPTASVLAEEDYGTSHVRLPRVGRIPPPHVTRYVNVHQHTVMVNVLQEPDNSPPIIVKAPAEKCRQDEEDDVVYDEHGAEFGEDIVYTPGPLDSRKLEVRPGDLIIVDIRASPNFQNGIYVGNNCIMGRDSNSGRVFKRNLASYNSFNRLSIKRGRCKFFPADEVVSRTNQWEGRNFIATDRWAFVIFCYTGLQARQAYARGLKITY